MGNAIDNSRLRFPRLNLSRSGAVQLVVFGSYESSEERLALLPGQVRLSPGNVRERGAMSRMQYTPRGATSYSILVGAHSDSDAKEIHVNFFYRRASTDASRRRSDLSENKFLDILQALGPAKEAHGTVMFEFDDREPHQLWFPLPVTLEGSSPEDVIEILGVRGAKRGASATSQEYEFILDRPEDQRVALQIELDLEQSISPDTPRVLLGRAERIARQLVRNV